MGVLPLEFANGETAKSLGLDGTEYFTITGIEKGLTPGKELDVTASNDKGKATTFKAVTRLDSKIEVEYYKHGGILQYVLRKFLQA